MSKRAWTVLPVALAAPIVYLIAVGFQQRAASPAKAGSVTDRVVEAANRFLTTLSTAERSRVMFGLTSSQRTGWSNLPSPIFQRNGLRFGDLTAGQRGAALKLVSTALSREGYQKVTDIMNGDEVLKNAGGGQTGGKQGGGGVRFGLDISSDRAAGDPVAAGQSRALVIARS